MGPKWSIYHEQVFFYTNHYFYFHLSISPFHCAKFNKNSYSRSRVMRMHHGSKKFNPKWPICPKQIFFWKKLLRSFSSAYRLLSLCKILKRFLQRIQSYEDAPFLGPKWPIRSNENFFRKPVNKNCSFHSCLSACQKSKSDINLLVKYWQLKNTEISLAESHFWL